MIAAATARALLRIEDPEASKMDATNQQIAVILMVLYSKAIGRKAGFSRTSDGKNTGGPMIRFVSACCEKMAIHLLPGSIARIKQRSFPKTDVYWTTLTFIDVIRFFFPILI